LSPVRIGSPAAHSSATVEEGVVILGFNGSPRGKRRLAGMNVHHDVIHELALAHRQWKCHGKIPRLRLGMTVCHLERSERSFSNSIFEGVHEGHEEGDLPQRRQGATLK
ncbi:MAG TPA: hypothetical protein VIB79_12940, partial [Candidatus Binatia bacterium]